ncbi:hypothetical protein K402DRAFT_389535 [Aulographum hederae CBS 113979]|uniref:ARS binding protein 2 n=1 Tax=Aulographum hederae CBS 113979 TaxID=1176131 RepID=A0A6G1HCE3_9PEZI|nr:hypothetical protein K402DRAFT_389535 [Aulographum hederae CBS 113979]
MNFHTPIEAEHLHLSAHARHFSQGGGSPNFPHAPFRHTGANGVDPGGSNGLHPSSSPHLLPYDNGMSPHHLPPSFRSDVSRSSAGPSPPSQSVSPRFAVLSSPGQTHQQLPDYTPDDRELPSANVNDNTIDDAFASFILFCNPSFSTSIDTSELKKVFRTPPKSDGKSFSTWTLFELIRKYDAGDIKTWTELALELGVEKPSHEKGQSTQKVQQYSVRLKRWMHAMHVDAFFEYLLGKPQIYYKAIPSPHGPLPESRDGVPLEEDLAIRALDPKFRPKRGRRKADEQDEENDRMSTPPPKRPHLDTSAIFDHQGFATPRSAYPGSAIPMSAHPDDIERFMHSNDPWSAAITSSHLASLQGKNLTPHSASTQQLRWRNMNNDNPSTPHPLSAVTPASAHPDSAFDEPQSAVTPSSARPRARRRHGPAVSSAWSSTSASTNGKLRGRPPNNRSTRDGPFVTFPANPKNNKESTPVDLGRSQISMDDPIPIPTSTTSVHPPSSGSGTPTGRRERLQLQVPQHVGGPVHLVTPTLLVNGEAGANNTLDSSTTLPSGITSSSGQTSGMSGRLASHFFEESSADEQRQTSSFSHAFTHPSEVHSKRSPSPNGQTRNKCIPIPNFTAEDLRRSLAADLLRADIKGRKRLRGAEAKQLADAVLLRLRSQQQQQQIQTSQDATDDEDLFRVTAASWLGLSAPLGLSSVGAPIGTAKKIKVTRFRRGGDGYDSPIDDDEDIHDGNGAIVKEMFDVSWNLLLGGLSGEFVVKGLVLDSAEDAAAGVQGLDEGEKSRRMKEGEEGWKERYLEAQRELRSKEEEVRKLRDKVLEAVL